MDFVRTICGPILGAIRTVLPKGIGFDISPVIAYVKNSNVNATRENSVEFDSKEGKGLISKYKIKKVPSLIITGEIGKVKIEGLEKSQDALIFTEIPPPFTNPETGRVEETPCLKRAC